MLHLADPRVSASKRFAQRANPCERGDSLPPRMAATGVPRGGTAAGRSCGGCWIIPRSPHWIRDMTRRSEAMFRCGRSPRKWIASSEPETGGGHGE